MVRPPHPGTTDRTRRLAAIEAVWSELRASPLELGDHWSIVTIREELTVSYDGNVLLLDDPLATADLRTAFEENP